MMKYTTLTVFCFLLSNSFFSQEQDQQMVRLAKLVIDSTQLESYNALLREEIRASVQLEPGVLTLYAVADKKKPTHITILEIYATKRLQKAYLDTTLS